jgi:hypothetical protein
VDWLEDEYLVILGFWDTRESKNLSSPESKSANQLGVKRGIWYSFSCWKHVKYMLRLLFTPVSII